MKKRVFYADADGRVEVLGMKIDAKPEEIHIIINGSDITEAVMLERVEIIIEKEKTE